MAAASSLLPATSPPSAARSRGLPVAGRLLPGAVRSPDCFPQSIVQRSTQSSSKIQLTKCNVLSAVDNKISSDSVKKTAPIIVIDNYDSFTYNLCQYIGELGAEFVVFRNDEITVEEIKKMSPRGILISPGPGTPQDSGISLQAVLELGPSIPLFGVCMGLQCIGEAFGGKIVRSPSGVVHGKSSPVYYNDKLDGFLFDGLPNPFEAARYHSLIIEKESFPHDQLDIMGWTEDGLIMAARHKKFKHIQGVQFHPESIITYGGKTMVKNFLGLTEKMEGSKGML